MTSQERTAKGNYTRWERSTDYSLDDVYKSYSTAKARAWRYCEQLCDEHNGTDLKVVGHNCMKFSAGFIFTDKETGVLKYMHITPSYDTAVEI